MTNPLQTPQHQGGGPDCRDLVRCSAAELNQSCFCITLDRGQLAAEMQKASGDPEFYNTYIVTRPHLFSSVPVFLPHSDLDAMLEIVHAIEAVVRTPQWTEAMLVHAPVATRRTDDVAGVFMGYDFHLGEGAPRLIEINTNAGGAFLNALAARAQLACCEEVEPLKARNTTPNFERRVLAMFDTEWRRLGRVDRPGLIAIVDEDPTKQYLYPEFLLARRMFEENGIAAVVAAPEDLCYDGVDLTIDGRRIDLVYNRLTDFSLDKPAHAALRKAWQDRSVVLTPSPHTHALYADKTNLAVLTDLDLVRSWGADQDTLNALATIPRAERVTHERADELWRRRKHLFFKPVAGYGGKAVYRGDKLTRSVFQDILASSYIVQDIALPSERTVLVDGQPSTRKMDVRLYTYGGELLLAAARLYQGQTTNFRTEGGGFAPVHFLAS